MVGCSSVTRTRVVARPGAPRRRSWSIAGLVLLIGAALGALVVLFVLPQAVPVSLVAPNGPAAVSVAREPFLDQRSVKITFGSPQSRTLTAPLAGRITRTTCVPGKTVHSGGAPFAVDGAPLLALATRVPLWRDLGSGSKGDDVVAVQKELRRLGYALAADGRWGGQSAAAWKALTKKAGAVAPDGSLTFSHVLWLPGTSVVATSCGAVLGDRVQEGAVLVSMPATAGNVSLSDLPDDLAAGDRVLVVGTERVHLAADLMLDDPARTAVLASPQAQKILNTDDEKIEPAIPAVLELATATDAAAVPAASILVDSTGACVFAPTGIASRVTILASSVGKTYLAAAAALPDSVLFDPPKGAKC